MATKGSHIEFMFLSLPNQPLDLLLCSPAPTPHIQPMPLHILPLCLLEIRITNNSIQWAVFALHLWNVLP